MRVAPAVALVALAGAAVVLVPPPAAAGGDPEAEGERLYLEGCSSCHGEDGGGAEDDAGNLRGPPVADSGEAAAFYYLSTGRMPLANSEEQPRRKDPAYDEEQIAALVAYVASLGDGPTLPEVDVAAADLVRGGELFRENCQACHSASGSGGALSYGRAAPPLAPARPDETAAAIRVGPGQMPVFGEEALSAAEVADVVRYVEYLDAPADPGGLPIGRLGPIPEGFVGWFLGVPLLLGATYWIGTRSPVRRRKGSL
ncbi:MAG: c-type cytochrome [Acidimicrobiia bacterium]|nr:c-type cytochrome [Acidimicrobiia bacterium]